MCANSVNGSRSCAALIVLRGLLCSGGRYIYAGRALRLSLRREELHLLEGGTAEKVVGITECFRHLVMVVSLADDKLYRLSRSFNGGDKVTGLALEFR